MQHYEASIELDGFSGTRLFSVAALWRGEALLYSTAGANADM